MTIVQVPFAMHCGKRKIKCRKLKRTYVNLENLITKVIYVVLVLSSGYFGLDFMSRSTSFVKFFRFRKISILEKMLNVFTTAENYRLECGSRSIGFENLVQFHA